MTSNINRVVCFVFQISPNSVSACIYHMDALFHPQIDFILKRGTGIKACLFDADSKQIISNLIPLSTFRDNGFFYFEHLANKDRTKIEGMCCVVILRPSSLRILLEEMLSPFYSSYIVLFTTQIDPFVLEIMANSDIHSVISEVHEINLGLYRQSLNLYTTNAFKRKENMEALHSLLLSLEISPTVLAPGDANGEELLGIGRELIAKIQQYSFKKRGTLVMLRRNFDLMTPMIYDWHYFSMINEHLKVSNSIVKVNNRDYILNDQFFIENRFGQIADVGEEIKKLIKGVEQSKVGMDDFDEIQEIMMQKNVGEAHLFIYNKIIGDAVAQQQTSEIENQVLLNKEFNISKGIEGLSYHDALRVLLIYFLKHVKNWEEYSKSFPKYRADILRFHELHKPQGECYRHGFNTEIDIKLGYISPLRRMIKHLILNKLRDGIFVKISSVEEVGPIIVFIDGGVTLREHRELASLSDDYNVEIILISTHILTLERFLGDYKA